VGEDLRFNFMHVYFLLTAEFLNNYNTTNQAVIGEQNIIFCSKYMLYEKKLYF